MGTMTGPNGYFYNGEWRDGKMHGKGLLKFLLGDKLEKATYEGQFENNQKSGFGKLITREGNTYEGQFKNDKKNGKGIFIYADGSILKANWVNDLIEGDGELIKINGSITRGKWQNN